MTVSETDLCQAPLHPQAIEGLRLFNSGQYFEAHEALEIAWLEEPTRVRDLYRGILQVAVVYLHATRENYAGVIKVYQRSQKWLQGWPEICRGVDVGRLQRDARAVLDAIEQLGPQAIAQFDRSLLKPVRWTTTKRLYVCDRCGHQMYEKNCKVTCPNCGNRFDCSDLNLYFD